MNRIIAKVISHHTEPNDVILYSVQATDLRTNRSKITKMRYSELYSLHQELQKLVIKLKMDLMLPDFPRKKVVGSTNKSEESISTRKKQLNQYLDGLICLQQLHCLQLFQKYFIPAHSHGKQHQNIHQDMNIHFSIDRYQIVDDVVIYLVRLRDVDTREEWTFKTRYSHLRNVHTALQANIRYLPPFPSKKIFGITNDSPEIIEKRREELEKYFNEIFINKAVLKSDAFTYFIEQSKKQAQYLQNMKWKKL